jgi:thiamine-phosphate pyrophosphorylase
MEMKKQTINRGLYLVVDPCQKRTRLLDILQQISKAPLAAVQVWDNPTLSVVDEPVISEICEVFASTPIPVLANNRIEWLRKFPFDGIHFDVMPIDWQIQKAAFNRTLITGLTLTNELDLLETAAALGLDYISFCSMFPSSTSNSCELVRPESVLEARKRFSLPIFLAGGIRPESLPQLSALPYDGVAVVSGIMQAEDPLKQIENYLELLKIHTHASKNY